MTPLVGLPSSKVPVRTAPLSHVRVPGPSRFPEEEREPTYSPLISWYLYSLLPLRAFLRPAFPGRLVRRLRTDSLQNVCSTTAASIRPSIDSTYPTAAPYDRPVGRQSGPVTAETSSSTTRARTESRTNRPGGPRPEREPGSPRDEASRAMRSRARRWTGPSADDIDDLWSMADDELERKEEQDAPREAVEAVWDDPPDECARPVDHCRFKLQGSSNEEQLLICEVSYLSTFTKVSLIVRRDTQSRRGGTKTKTKTERQQQTNMKVSTVIASLALCAPASAFVPASRPAVPTSVEAGRFFPFGDDGDAATSSQRLAAGAAAAAAALAS
ncbi:hypothetical protein THAOC_18891, partial [Thalassiosira oceanica]